MDFHLANFYKAYQDGWDKVQGGMRHGFAVEKRIHPIDYSKTLEVAEYKAVQTQVIDRLNRLDEFKYTPIKLDDGKSYPATTIDVGDEAINRASQIVAGNTIVTVNNPANGTGVLDTVETWFATDAQGFKVGTFSGSGTSYDDRDYETIGAVTSGSKQTFTGLSIDVEAGDFIGCYAAGGFIARSTIGYTAIYNVRGDKFGKGSATYTLQSGQAISLYAKGETGGLDISPPSITSTLTFGTAKLNLNIVASGIPSTVSFGSHTVKPDAVNIKPSGIASTATIGSATIKQGLNISPSSITPTTSIGTPTLIYKQYITPASITSTVTFGEPVITSGQGIYPPSITSTISFGSAFVISPPPPALKYVIELRTSAGALMQIFEAAYNISYTRVLNEPHSLSFNLRGTDAKRADIRHPYELWLRKNGNVIKKFILTNESDSDSNNNLITQISASSLLAQLGMETLQSDLTITGTVRNVLSKLLTHQRLKPAITLGTVEPTSEISMNWTGHPTLLACLNNVHEAVGGYFDVNDNRVLNWLDDVGNDDGKQIRQGKNIANLVKDRSWLSFATVLYPTGNDIKLSDKTVSMEVANKSADDNYGYLTLPEDYVCFKTGTLEITRKGTAVNYIGTSASGVSWWNFNNVLDIDWTTYAYWEIGYGSQTTNKLIVFLGATRTISGCKVRLRVVTTGTILKIFTYANDVLKQTDFVNYTPSSGNVEHSIDFGEAVFANNISIEFQTASNNTGGTIQVYSFWAWSEYFNETTSWTNLNDRQLRRAIAYYYPDDTYYLSYTLADYLKDLEAISIWSDSDGNGGIVSQSMDFSYVNDVDTLLMYGKLYLPTVSYPPTTYQLEAALLNEVHANFSDDEVDIGDIVSVIHEDLDITVSTRILKIVQPWLDIAPAEATMEISTQIKTLADAFRTLWNKV
jgi:hypothetical protein